MLSAWPGIVALHCEIARTLNTAWGWYVTASTPSVDSPAASTTDDNSFTTCVRFVWLVGWMFIGEVGLGLGECVWVGWS